MGLITKDSRSVLHGCWMVRESGNWVEWNLNFQIDLDVPGSLNKKFMEWKTC